MSEDSEIDGRFIPVEDVIRLTVEGDAGSLISCLPGLLGGYVGEEPNAAWITTALVRSLEPNAPSGMRRAGATRPDRVRAVRLIRPFQQRGAVRHLLEPFRGV